MRDFPRSRDCESIGEYIIKQFIYHEEHEDNEEKDYKIKNLILRVASCSSWLFRNIEYFQSLSSFLRPAQPICANLSK